MKLHRLLVCICVLTSLTGACSSDGGDGPQGTGGVGPTGGAASGGATSTGGTASGGIPGNGGASAAGGATSTGGIAGNGGAPATGGAAASGGADGSGGAQGGTGGSAPSCPSTATVTSGDTSVTMKSGGLDRQFHLHVPANYDGKKAVPLVLDFHGFMNFLPIDAADSQRNGSGYKAVADREGFIVAYPNGVDRAWNLGTCCTQSRTVDDVQFMRDLVERIKKDACIDPKRVYAVGYSNGGGLAHLLACRAADVFAAVAPAAFDLIEETGECKPSRPITEISFRGQTDPIVPYAGGNPPAPPSSYPLDPVHFLGAEPTFEKWSTINGCSAETATTGSNADYDCKVRTQCQAGTEVALCKGKGASSSGHVVGDAAMGWAMLKKHAMP